MPTRTGVAAVVFAAAALLGGRLLGSIQLYIAGAVPAALLVVAVVQVVARSPRMQPGSVQCRRTTRPWRVHAGEQALVHLEVTNGSRRRSPTLELADSVGPVGSRNRRRTTLWVPPLEPGEQVAATWQLPTSRRGRLAIGPVRATVTDACGLLKSTRVVEGATELLVRPAVGRLPAAAASGSGRVSATRRHTDLTGGEDFHALRAYQAGDDLRLVHWPSAARLDDLVVRRHENVHHDHTVVVLDVADASHTPASFELCVSAAASVLVAGAAAGDLLTLLTTDGAPPVVWASGDVDGTLDHLATVDCAPATRPDAVWSLIPGDSTVVAITTTAGSPALADAMAQASGGDRRGNRLDRRGPGGGVIIQFHPSSWDPSVPETAPGAHQQMPGRSVTPLTVTASQPFASCWMQWTSRTRADHRVGS